MNATMNATAATAVVPTAAEVTRARAWAILNDMEMEGGAPMRYWDAYHGVNEKSPDENLAILQRVVEEFWDIHFPEG